MYSLSQATKVELSNSSVYLGIANCFHCYTTDSKACHIGVSLSL